MLKFEDEIVSVLNYLFMPPFIWWVFFLVVLCLSVCTGCFGVFFWGVWFLVLVCFLWFLFVWFGFFFFKCTQLVVLTGFSSQ